MTTIATVVSDDVLSDEEILDDIYKKVEQETQQDPSPPSHAFERDMVVAVIVAPAKLLTKSEDGKPRLATLNTTTPRVPGANNVPSQNSSNGRKPKYYAPVYSVKDRIQDKTGSAPPNNSISTTTPPSAPSVDTSDQKPQLNQPNGRANRNSGRGGRGDRSDRGDKGDNRRERGPPNRNKEELVRKTREEEIIRKREEQIMKIREEEERLLEEERIQREQREKEEREERDKKFREKEDRERRIREKEREKQLAKERLMKTRTPGDKATVQDLQSVVFSPSSTFETGEAVIVPRVVYPNGQRDNLFKDLPAAYVGKLPSMYESELPVVDDVDGEREVGQKPQVKDLHNAVFSPTSKFAVEQIVLVPRSKGGFTYGRIVGECTFPCRLEEAHKHDVTGYRVLVSPGNEPKVRKDVLSGNLGKLYLPEQLQAALQAANEVAALTATPTTTSVRPPAPRVIKPPELPRDDEEGLEEEVGIMYPPAASTNSEPIRREVINVPPSEDNKPKRGMLEVPRLFAKTKPVVESSSKPARTPPRRKPHNKENKSKKTTPLIVIDGPNVAMKHGKKKAFSVAGISIALEYYTSRGFDAVAFVPEVSPDTKYEIELFYMATRKANITLGNSTLKLGDFMTVGDDLPALLDMADEGLVVLTPPQDYDDSYCIEYAKKHRACIVTNDRYNDHIDKQKTDRDKAQDRRFIRDHCISFTFVRDEFMPNPDFVFPQDHPGE